MFCNAQRYLVYVVDLVFDGRSKEGWEPPGGDAGPEGRVDSVECWFGNDKFNFEIFWDIFNRVDSVECWNN